MSEDVDQITEVPMETGSARARPSRRRRIFWLACAILALLLLSVWLARKNLADNFIASQLNASGLNATYDVVSISPERQIISNLVIGDPKRPDLTVERVEVRTRLGWGLPGIGRITVVRPRLYGQYHNGKVSFGNLDRVLFTGSKEPFRLPDLNIALVDGRARIDTDYGAAAFKLDGAGELRDGFSGVIAAVMPRFDGMGCQLADASVYGKLSVSSERPRLVGPLRLSAMNCPNQAFNLQRSALQLDVRFDAPLTGAEGRVTLAAGKAAYGDYAAERLEGPVRFTWRRDGLTADYTVKGQGFAMPQLAAKAFTLEGLLRAPEGLRRMELEGAIAAQDLAAGSGLDQQLRQVEANARGTLGEALLRRFRTGLQRQLPGSSLTANHILRLDDGRLTVIVPQARLTGGGGEALAAVSRLQIAARESGPPRISGNFVTGGADIPRFSGRVDRDDQGIITANLALAEYGAGSDKIAVPRLTLVHARNGAIGFSGAMSLSGALPGGHATNLRVPVQGSWSLPQGLSLWRRCVPVAFDTLTVANLRLERRDITICPANGGGIVRYHKGGLRIAAGATALNLAGYLGETPIRISSGPIGFAYPGQIAARALDVELGPSTTASKFRVARLSAQFGRDIAGTVSESEVYLAAVPLDLVNVQGNWRFADGRLALNDASFLVKDRQLEARFQPLKSEGASLTLQDNAIVADALLSEPASGMAIVKTSIRHNLASASGSADLAVDGVTFDRTVQPDTLSRLALGVIANAEGTVRGSGRIDWSPRAITSTGRFTTDSLNFAAAFGPVKGASGAIEFTDLLGLVTAPDQRIKLASINPGIEVNDGELSYEMRPGHILAVNGAHWPFMGGTLTLQPTQMAIGVAETRHYTLMVEGLNAAELVQRMELANLNATGVFDGKLPLVFDQNGGKIVGGILLSRPPGGNVSYVGQLTYKDLSAMGNFAFAALRSIDYRQMQIEMDGALQGEIVTRVAFDGLSQGTGAQRNFITNQIAKLPIRFRVNVRAPFMGLFGSFRSLSDPTYVADPRTLGLMGPDGKPVKQPTAPPPVIQPPVSENKP